MQLFKAERPGEERDWLDDLDRGSEEVLCSILISPRLEGCKAGERFQFERGGYFVVDKDSKPGKLVFNRTCTLQEAYKRKQK